MDWRDKESQELRFAQPLQICGRARNGSLIELGCGYGALYQNLRRHGYGFNYIGYDLSEGMIRAARPMLEHDPKAKIAIGWRPGEIADYCVASGIFNIRFAFSDAEWQGCILETLDHMA